MKWTKIQNGAMKQFTNMHILMCDFFLMLFRNYCIHITVLFSIISIIHFFFIKEKKKILII